LSISYPFAGINTPKEKHDFFWKGAEKGALWTERKRQRRKKDAEAVQWRGEERTEVK
jgi:hypothetical protein